MVETVPGCPSGRDDIAWSDAQAANGRRLASSESVEALVDSVFPSIRVAEAHHL
jgi:hypothetical protein